MVALQWPQNGYINMRINKNVKYLGSIRHKKFWTALIDSDAGLAETLWFAYFPAYTRPGWGMFKAAARSAEMETNQTLEYHISCRYANVPHTFDPNVDDIGPTVREFMPLELDQILDTDEDFTDTPSIHADVGVTGRTVKSKQGKAQEIYGRSYEAEFPKHMYASSSDNARMLIHSRYEGHFITNDSFVDISQPSLMVCEVWKGDPNGYTGVPGAHGNVSNMMSGDLTSDVLYQAMTDHLKLASAASVSADALPATLQQYAWYGSSDSAYDATEEPDIEVRAYTSFPVDVYEPIGSNYVPAP